MRCDNDWLKVNFSTLKHFTTEKLFTAYFFFSCKKATEKNTAGISVALKKMAEKPVVRGNGNSFNVTHKGRLLFT